MLICHYVVCSSTMCGQLRYTQQFNVHFVQGRIQGGHRGHVPPPSPKYFFTNIILHRRVLFSKFTDIAVMFLSRDSLH